MSEIRWYQKGSVGESASLWIEYYINQNYSDESFKVALRNLRKLGLTYDEAELELWEQTELA